MDSISTDQVGGAVRALLAVATGYLAAKYSIDSEVLATASGAIVTLAVIGWSLYTNRAAKLTARA